MIPGWEMDWNPYYYYGAFEGFVNNIFIWIIVAFAALNLGALIYCVIKAGGFNDDFYTYWGLALFYNVLGLIIVFAVSSMIFSIGDYFSKQNWDLFGQYYGTLVNQSWAYITVGVISAAVLIIGFFFMGPWSILAGLLTYPVLLYVAGFIIYVVIWFLWLLIRFVYVIVTVLGMALVTFCINHWWELLLNIVVPAVILGLITALGAYIASLAGNVNFRLVGGPRYSGGSNREAEDLLTEDNSGSSSSSGGDDDIIVD